MNQYRLTETEIQAAFNKAVSPDGTLDIYQTIADAATGKAVGQVVVWLRGFETALPPDHPELRLAVNRGHGLEMAADELEAMLTAGGS